MDFTTLARIYTDLLILESPEVVRFVDQHRDDELFMTFVAAHAAFVTGYMGGQELWGLLPKG